MIIDEEDNVLEHVGVKGMKWGVRRERRLQVLQRSSVKGGTAGISKTRAVVKRQIGPIDFVKGRGLTGGTKRKAERLGAQLERHKQGKSTALDLVKRYGSTRMSDFVPVRDKNVTKRTTHKADIAVLVAAGSLFALRLAQKSAQAR